MKKILSIVLMGLLMISSAGVRVNADDSDPSPESCEVSRPLVTNLRIEDGMLEWDEGEGAENETYEVRITDGVTYVEGNYTTEKYFDVLDAIETKMGQGSHSGVNFTVPGLYSFNVFTVAEGDECNAKRSVEKKEWVVDPSVIGTRVFTEDDESNEGGTVQTTSDNLGFTDSEIKVSATPKEGYEVSSIKVGGKSYELWMELSSNTVTAFVPFEDAATLNGTEWEYKTIDVDFSKKGSKTIIADFGSGHDSFLQKVKQYVETDEDIDADKVAVDGTKLLLTLPFSSSTSMTGLQIEVLSFISGAIEDNYPIDNNELLLLTSRNKNVNDLGALIDEIQDEDTLAKDYNYTCYLIWVKYESKEDKEWTLGDKGTADFTFTRNINDDGFSMTNEDEEEFVLQSTYNSFVKVEVDGKEISADDYETAKGSLILKLKDSFLNSLSAGEHQVKAYFNFSPNVDIQEAPLLSSQATLTVKEKPVKKTTGYKFPVTGID